LTEPPIPSSQNPFEVAGRLADLLHVVRLEPTGRIRCYTKEDTAIPELAGNMASQAVYYLHCLNPDTPIKLVDTGLHPNSSHILGEMPLTWSQFKTLCYDWHNAGVYLQQWKLEFSTT